MDSKPIHSGHRERLKQRFLREGLSSFTDFQALELLLYFAIPRIDTNPIAHQLIDHFGGLVQVMNAAPDQLAKVPGVGMQSALLIHLVMEMSRFYQVADAKQARYLPTLEDCGEYLMPHFLGCGKEKVILLCLDAKCKILCCKEIASGSSNATNLSTRDVVQSALAADASMVVLAHNHPSGVALPSDEDVRATRLVAAALNAVEIKLADHVIVADRDYVSMAQSGYCFYDRVIR